MDFADDGEQKPPLLKTLVLSHGTGLATFPRILLASNFYIGI
jgi:hypothetical protein